MQELAVKYIHMENEIKMTGDYNYHGADSWENDYLIAPVTEIIRSLDLEDKRLFEVGFGNGWTANYFANQGYHVTGIEPSESGVIIANQTYPELNLEIGNAYEDLSMRFGTFPAVYSLEVIEHCQYPRMFVRAIYELLETEGTGIITTPYHGYIKNLVIAFLGKCESHYNPLWDDGHLRFFSNRALSSLLLEAGFREVKFIGAGRISPIYKSTIAIAKK